MHSTEDSTYSFNGPLTKHQILERASEILAQQLIESDVYSVPEEAIAFLEFKLSHYEREVFGVMLLDNRHRLLEFKELFFGTIDSASIYPREVVKAVLADNAAAVIFAHNHPSGIAEPSRADISITQRLVDALALIDVRVLDHIIVGHHSVSFAERGLL
ncbi:RadC family protein [Marinobacterium jannaschii]|uniref:RadC family protein n=1 Tax=Marinobacterium jannaschii TaxID=64970 RepID=UPI0004879C01|nr:DNA repair protein RadC [Marinobacterium jannaschii]